MYIAVLLRTQGYSIKVKGLILYKLSQKLYLRPEYSRCTKSYFENLKKFNPIIWPKNPTFFKNRTVYIWKNRLRASKSIISKSGFKVHTKVYKKHFNIKTMEINSGVEADRRRSNERGCFYCPTSLNAAQPQHR